MFDINIQYSQLNSLGCIFYLRFRYAVCLRRLFNAPQVVSLFVRTDIHTTYSSHCSPLIQKCGTGKMCGHYISRLGVAALQLLAELTISQSLYVALCLKLLLKLTTSQFLLLHIKDIRFGFTSMMFAFPPAYKISCILSFSML